MTELPPRVRNCTTHHEACDCREWHYKEALLALRLIRTWAFFVGARNHDQEELRTLILNKSNEVIEAFNTLDDKRMKDISKFTDDDCVDGLIAKYDDREVETTLTDVRRFIVKGESYHEALKSASLPRVGDICHTITVEQFEKKGMWLARAFYGRPRDE